MCVCAEKRVVYDCSWYDSVHGNVEESTCEDASRQVRKREWYVKLG